MVTLMWELAGVNPQSSTPPSAWCSASVSGRVRLPWAAKVSSEPLKTENCGA